MKPRIRKFLAGLLSFGLLLQAASPLSALAANTTTAEKELKITVVQGSNTYTKEFGPEDKVPSFYWGENVDISYADGTYTVNGRLGYNSSNTTITVEGINNHKPSVNIAGSAQNFAVSGTLTASNLTNFTTQKGIDGSATLTCDGDVTINSTYGGAVTNRLSVENANNVTITSKSSTAMFGASATNTNYTVCSIKASNDVTLTNSVGPLTNLTGAAVNITATGNISLTGTSNSVSIPMVGDLGITGTGAIVDVQNNGTGCAVNYCYSSQYSSPKSFSVTSGGPVIRSHAQIYVDGDVTLTGSTDSYKLLPNSSSGVPVAVRAGSLTIMDTNSTGSNAIGYAKFTPRSSSKTYHVYKGTSASDAQEDTSVQVTSSDPFMEDVTSKYLYIGEGEPALPTALTVALTSGGTTTTAKVNPKTTSIFSDGKAVGVAYDVGTDTYTFTGQLGSRWTSPDDHDSITITGSGTAKPNVVLNKGSGDLYAVWGLLTVENVTDLTCGSIYGAANLNCAGDVNLTDGVAVGGLTVESAHDVTVAANNGSYTVTGTIDITCSGDVEITNSGNGTLTNSFLMLNDITGSIKLNGSGEYRENDASSTAGMLYLKNCTGTLEINSTGTGRAVSELSCTDGTLLKSVTINSKSTTAAVGYDTYYSVNIVSSGDVKITNTNGPVAGGNLTVKADTVTLNGSSADNLIADKFSAYITAASLTAENSGTGAVGQVKFTKTGTGDYKVVTGSSASAADKTESALDDAGYDDTCKARYLQITPGTPAPEVPENAEMKLTIGDEVYYLTQETYSLPGKYHVSITSSPYGYALTGQLTSSDGTGSIPKVTIEGVNSKKLNLQLNTSNTPGYLTMGDLEIKNIGDVYVYDWVGGDLTITDVGGVETHPVDGSLTVTNAGSVSTGLVGGNMTLTNVGKVIRSYFSNSNGTIDIDAAGEVNIYGSSSTGSQISAGATISATKLVMQFSGLHGNTGTVGHVNFTRKDTASAYRILTGDSSDAITYQAAMPDTTFDQTVDDVYLCIEPGEPEDTSELAITLNGVTTKFGQNAKQAALGSVSIIYSSTDKTYHISGAFTGDVAISGVNGKKPNVKMDNSNGDIVSGSLTVTDVTNFTAESSVGSLSTGTLSVTAAGDVSLTGDFNGATTIVSAKSLTMWNNRTNPTLGNVTFTAPDGKTYVATTDESDPTQTIEVPNGSTVSGGYLHIAPADTTDDTPDDTPAGISGDDSGAGGAIAAVALGGAAVWGGYQVATRIILHKLLPEGTAIPANRGQLALLVWNEAGRPEPANAPAFTDAADADMAKAAQWCTEQGYLDAKTESTFKPDGLATKVKVIEVWNTAFPKN